MTISLPGSKKAVECFKDLLVSGQTSALSKPEREEVGSLLSDIGLKWNIVTVNELFKDDASLDDSEHSFGGNDSSGQEESSDNEDDGIEDFWVISKESQQIGTVKWCKASCLKDCRQESSP